MKRSILYIIICLVAFLPASAKSTFRTAELERLAKELALNIEALPDGYCHLTANGVKLTVHQKEQTIDHIGLYLFSEELRKMGKSPIFDFLERYFLQLKYPSQIKSTQNIIRDDQFTFLIGSLESVDNILLTDGFSFNYDNHRYQATWNRNDSTLLSVSFPVEYELISGENKIEAEDNLINDVRSTNVAIPEGEPVIKKDHYLSENITNRLYLQNGMLVASAQHPAESVANMMLSLQTEGDYQISITQMSYGFKKTVFEVPLRQWIAFCHTHGCELYFGIEKISDGGNIECVVVAVNEAENYNHVMTVLVPSDILEARTGKIEARLYPYVPTHNVLNMFAAYRKSNPKTFVSK